MDVKMLGKLWGITAILIMAGMFSSCKKNPVAPNRPQPTDVTLSASYVSSTEALLKIGFAGGGDYEIARGSTKVLRGHFAGGDTTVLDDSLSPATSYEYTGFQVSNDIVLGMSSGLQLQTLGLTSNDYQWKTFLIGDPGYSTSLLRDVAIISDTLIYAVGSVYLNDSTGTIDQIPYCLAKWDGHEWKESKMNYVDGGQSCPVTGFSSIQFIATDKIWFGGGSVFSWDGSSTLVQLSFSRMSLSNPNATIQRIWISPSNNIYGVGNTGAIICFDGTQWKEMASGTPIDLEDVFGSPDGRTVYAAGYDRLTGQTSVLLKYNGVNWQTIYSVAPDDPRWNVTEPDTICGVVSTIWTYSGSDLLSGTTSAIYQSFFTKSQRTDRIGWAPPYPIGFIHLIRGTGPNDIVVVGDFNTIAHWNGASWANLSSSFDTQTGSSLYSVAIKNNMIVAVGTIAGKAEIIMGKR